jgi:hypothetical protein
LKKKKKLQHQLHFPTSTWHHQANFLVPLPGRKRRLLRGEFSHTHLLLCFIALLYFIYFTCIILNKKTQKKLESLVVVISLLLVYHVVP